MGAMELSDFFALCAGEHGLVVVATLRADSTIQSSLVNAGIVAHPVSGQEVLGFVTYGPAKLGNLRRRPTTAVTARSGWQWATVEGSTEIVGPDDPMSGVDAERLRVLLRDIFSAAGGTHDDWDAYDATMAEQRRAAVLVHPTRIYSNASRT
jgi:PPOX class probable F420-dependent enzyme